MLSENLNTQQSFRSCSKSAPFCSTKSAAVASLCSHLISAKREGPLTSLPATTYAFISSRTFMSEEEQQKWKEGALSATKNAPAGLRKQYESQIERFLDPSSAEGECVIREGSVAIL